MTPHGPDFRQRYVSVRETGTISDSDSKREGRLNPPKAWGAMNTDFVAKPYRDRQLIAVVREITEASDPKPIRLSDYEGLASYKRAWDARQWLTKEYWNDSRSYGIAGYLFDKTRAKAPSDGGGSSLTKITGTEASAELLFPPGHPLYETVYVGHPLRPPVYVPLASFHRACFDDKFNELLSLLIALGAVSVTIRYEYGYRDASAANASITLPLQTPLSIGAGGRASSAQGAAGLLGARFNPSGTPHVPEECVWYPFEATWQSVARARLRSGLAEIDAELRYDDDFGVDAKVALSATGVGFKIGGDFSKHERTLWKFHADFG